MESAVRYANDPETGSDILIVDARVLNRLKATHSINEMLDALGFTTTPADHGRKHLHRDGNRFGAFTATQAVEWLERRAIDSRAAA